MRPIPPASLQQEKSVPVFDIQPSRGWLSLNFRELWEYRDLLYILIWRDIKIRYKQTLLGAAWAILQPVMTMVVFSIFFGKLANVPSDGFPYPIFTYTALLPWQLFSNAMSESSHSLVANQSLITKVYFPRLVVPLASVFSGLVDFAISFVVLIILMVAYGITPTLSILTLPLFILMALLTAFTVGLWLSALNVEYRDVRYTIPFLTQFWLFITPIAYPTSNIPEQWRLLYGLNPMVGVVEGFRWALLGKAPSIGPLVFISTLVVVVLLVCGLVYFRHMEDTFADVI